MWEAALWECTQHKYMVCYSVAVVESMLNISLLLFFNNNENWCDGSKNNKSLFSRNTVYESVLENPSIAQSSLYVAIIIQHFVSVYVYMLQYISTTVMHGANVLPCYKHQQWLGINCAQTRYRITQRYERTTLRSETYVVERELHELQYDVQIFGLSLLIIAENLIFLSLGVFVCTYSI